MYNINIGNNKKIIIILINNKLLDSFINKVPNYENNHKVIFPFTTHIYNNNK